MAYQGGKALVKEYILRVLNHPVFDGWDFGDVFFGMGHIGSGVKNKRSYHFSDLSPRLVALHDAVRQHGVEALPHISKTKYDALRALDGNDAISGAAAYLYTWQGKEWGGYIDRRHGRCYAKARLKHLKRLRRSEAYRNATFQCCSIFDYSARDTDDTLIYCDPPYKGTTNYRVNKDRPFDHEAYWAFVRKLSVRNVVFTSECTAPPDFISVASYQTRGRTEHLYLWDKTGTVLNTTLDDILEACGNLTN